VKAKNQFILTFTISLKIQTDKNTATEILQKNQTVTDYQYSKSELVQEIQNQIEKIWSYKGGSGSEDF